MTAWGETHASPGVIPDWDETYDLSGLIQHTTYDIQLKWTYDFSGLTT
jgi:hypothetical protein